MREERADDEGAEDGQHGRDGDVHHKRHADAVAAEQMAERDGRIDLINALGCAEEDEQEDLKREQDRMTGRKLARAVKDREKRAQGTAGGVPCHEDQHGRNADEGADERDDDGRQALARDELPRPDGQREHEIALVLQKAVVEPLDDAQQRQHDHGDDDRHIQQHRKDGRECAEHPGQTAGVIECEVVDERNDEHAAPDEQKALEHGAKVVFEQFSEHQFSPPSEASSGAMRNISRKSASTDLPRLWRMLSTVSCRTTPPSRKNTASSSTRSMSPMRCVEMRIVASGE